jgi:hypothetical protein
MRQISSHMIFGEQGRRVLKALLKKSAACSARTNRAYRSGATIYRRTLT